MSKLSSKNFDELMKSRGLSKEDSYALKKSMYSMMAKHAKAGEKFVTTHGTENSSGIFVSSESLGNTPEERKKNGALPHSNSAEYETTVALSRDQDLLYGKIAPQSKFQKMDADNIPREGGAEQVVTDGGYKNDAVVNSDAKYPMMDNKKELFELKNGHSNIHNQSRNDKSNSQSH